MKIRDALIIISAFFLRAFDLASKPPHFDEGIIGWFADQILVHGFYKYDPQNYHGPFHYYLVLLFQTLFGHNLWSLRLPAALFGAGAVAIILLMKNKIGERPATLGAVFCAISPALVFYSRMSILEADLLFFTLLFVYGLLCERAWVWPIAFAGMIVIKETWSLFVLALLPAYFSSGAISKIKFKIIPIVLALLIFVTFYSGFFKNAVGIIDFFKAYVPWIKTGINGKGHEKPVSYWLILFKTYEFLTLLGLVGGIRFLFSKSKPVFSFLAVLGWIQLIIYSWISYKTPWCILSIIWPFLILAGALVDECLTLARTKRKRILIWGVAGILAGHDLAQAINLNFFQSTNESEPYVYVQTYPQVMGVIEDLNRAASEDPLLLESNVYVFLASQWPLPWLLAPFKNSFYFTGTPPEMNSPAVVFSDVVHRVEVEGQLDGIFYFTQFKLRPAMGEVIVYFSEEVFKNIPKDKSKTVYQKWEPTRSHQ